MTKNELSSRLSELTGVTKQESQVLVDTMFNIMGTALSEGDDIIIRGFGRMFLKTRKAKIARNITKGTKINVPEHSVVMFKASSDLKKSVENVKPAQK